jgi:hypothetical protein
MYPMTFPRLFGFQLAKQRTVPPAFSQSARAPMLDDLSESAAWRRSPIDNYSGSGQVHREDVAQTAVTD